MKLLLSLFIVLLLLAVALAGLMYWLRQRRQRLDRQMGILAEEWQVEMTIPQPTYCGLLRGYPSLYGKVDERDFFLTVQSSGFEESFSATTVITLTTQLDRAFDFSLQRRRGLRRQAIRFEGESWQAGVEEFDQAFVCRTSNPEQMERYFSREVCIMIAQRWRSGNARMVLREGGLSIQQLGLIFTDDQRSALAECFSVALQLLSEFEKADA